MSGLSYSSPRLEVVAVVAVVGAHHLDVYVDDYASNAPFGALDVRLRTAHGSTTLSEREPGLYSTAIDPRLEDAAITLQIRGPGWLETVSGSLEINESTQPVATSASILDAWPAAALLLLVVGLRAFTIWRRRQA